tara:strand:- start:748 stop:1962 length:1215 start_codon:yes stop_codon:yes gene_type:complete
MSSTYSTSLRIELQGTGENSGTWGTITNNNFSQSIEFSIAGVVDVACGDNAVTTLTNADGPQSQANNQARNAHIRLTGAHGAVRIAQFPATQKIYLITNATTDSGSSGPYAMTARLGASGNTLTIENGATRLVATDGTDWYDVFAGPGTVTAPVDLNGQTLTLDADADTTISAASDDVITFKVANANQLTLSDGALSPSTTNDIDLGTASLEFKDAFFDGTVRMDAIGFGTTSMALPSADGTSGQFLRTDGSGTLSFATVSTSVAFDDITAGDSAVNVTTTAGNITIDAQGDNTDIIFKGTDNTADTTFLTLDGSEAGTATFNSGATFGGSVLPSADDTHDLGSSTLQWRDIYTGDLNLNNTKTRNNEVDGTSGHWTIQEGDENLFILNRLNGKKYKFKLEEIA